MPSYIIPKDEEKNFEFTIMNVKDKDADQFEKDNKDKILAKGDNIQEAIIAFSEKKNQWEPIYSQSNSETNSQKAGRSM